MRGLSGSVAFVCLMAAFTAPAIAAECGPLKVMASLPLTHLAPGDVATIPVSIGDVQKNFLVDTGAFSSVVGERIVRELNLPTARSSNGMSLRGVSGDTTELMARLPSITIGNMRQNDPLFFVGSLGFDPADAGPLPFDGIIGANMLSFFDADFDFAAGKLNLISQDHCAGKVTYWSAPKIAIVPFSMARAGWISFKLELDGRRLTALLDTGASNTNLNADIARRTFKFDPNEPGVEKLGQLQGVYTADVYRRKFKTISFEGITVSDPMITVLPDMMSRQGAQSPRVGSLITEKSGLPDIILGMSVLSKLHLYIAYKERKLYITEAGMPSAPANP